MQKDLRSRISFRFVLQIKPIEFDRKKVFATKTLKCVIEIATIVIEKAAKMTTYYLVPM